MIRRLYSDNNNTREMIMSFNSPLIFNDDEIVEILLSNLNVVYINQLETATNMYMYIDKINNTYYNSNPNPMPCNFLDLAISPRINSTLRKCLYFAENYDKKNKTIG